MQKVTTVASSSIETLAKTFRSYLKITKQRCANTYANTLCTITLTQTHKVFTKPSKTAPELKMSSK